MGETVSEPATASQVAFDIAVAGGHATAVLAHEAACVGVTQDQVEPVAAEAVPTASPVVREFSTSQVVSQAHSTQTAGRRTLKQSAMKPFGDQVTHEDGLTRESHASPLPAIDALFGNSSPGLIALALSSNK